MAPYSGSLEFGPEEASTLGDGQYGATGQVIFVSRKGKVLFLRRASGVAEAGEWDLPGRHVEQGEDAQVAARRESLEETGVRPQPRCGWSTASASTARPTIRPSRPRSASASSRR